METEEQKKRGRPGNEASIKSAVHTSPSGVRCRAYSLTRAYRESAEITIVLYDNYHDNQIIDNIAQP